MESTLPPYRILVNALASDNNEVRFVARAPELPGCEAHGATRAEAITSLEQELEAQIANIKDQGGEVPSPLDMREFTGEVMLKVSPELHRELVYWAQQRSLDLNAALCDLLTRAINENPPSRRARGAEQRGGAPRRGSFGSSRGNNYDARAQTRQRYQDIMDNRESFIEYVRQSERSDQPSGPRNPRPGGGGRGRRRS